MVDHIEATWQSQCNKNRGGPSSSAVPVEDCGGGGKPKRSQAGLETEYMAHITLRFPNMFSTYKNFDECNKLWLRLQADGSWQELHDWFNKYCEFSYPALDHSTIIRVMYQITEVPPSRQQTINLCLAV